MPGPCASVPQAADFTLLDDAATPWRLSDTCPATLAKLVRSAEALGAPSQRVEIVFVTVDPKRDSPAALRRFIARFDKPGQGRIVGLTGTSDRMAAVERSYHVWSQAVPADEKRQLRGVVDDEDSQATLTRAMVQLLG
jgi:cytochrome oxidase Cu insertion factor (SCO1/SenC/PrrC family)